MLGSESVVAVVVAVAVPETVPPNIFVGTVSEVLIAAAVKEGPTAKEPKHLSEELLRSLSMGGRVQEHQHW